MLGVANTPVAVTDVPGTDLEPNPAPAEHPDALVPGSPLARVLFEVLSGRPITVVNSPPGAGKSTLVAQVVDRMRRHTDATIEVVVFTNDQGADLAERIAHELGPDKHGKPQVRVGSVNMEARPGVGIPSASLEGNAVTVSTATSAGMRQPQVDLMIVDEAYQVTFADFALAAERAVQILAVGDPGQIGPVVSFDTFAWKGHDSGPHLRCPEVLSRRADSITLSLPATYRLGPQTVEAIAPLYPFGFESRRPARTLDGFTGEIAALELPVREHEYDLDSMRTVVDVVAGYVGATVHETIGADHFSRTLAPADVAVVVSRNSQSSTIETLLAARGLEDVTVGTADRLQGGQWHAVVAVDPALSGAGSGHAMSSGRLCVMASRHMAHMTWIYDASWTQTLADYEDRVDAEKGAAVRRALTGVSQ